MAKTYFIHGLHQPFAHFKRRSSKRKVLLSLRTFVVLLMLYGKRVSVLWCVHTPCDMVMIFDSQTCLKNVSVI